MEIQITENFIKRRRRNISRILRALINDSRLNVSDLKGVGIDLGSHIGISSKVLRDLGANNLYSVELSAPHIQFGIARGFTDPEKSIEAEAGKYLSGLRSNVDFITFFGATSYADLLQIQDLAQARLNPSGIFLLTTMPELDPVVDRMLTKNGEKFRPDSTHWWDKIGYIYRK